MTDAAVKLFHNLVVEGFPFSFLLPPRREKKVLTLTSLNSLFFCFFFKFTSSEKFMSQQSTSSWVFL